MLMQKKEDIGLQYVLVVPLSSIVSLKKKKYRKIPKTSPGAYMFQRPFSRGLFLEGFIFVGGGGEGA